MSPDRRRLLALGAAFAASPAWAEAPIAALSAYERATGGRIGVFARNLANGRSIAWRADERFIMCSTFKASLAACLLRQVETGKAALDEPLRFGTADLLDYAPVARKVLAKAGGATAGLSIEAACRGAVEWSDNTCANLLLARIGGPGALTAFWRAIGDQVSRLDRIEPDLNRSAPGDLRDTTTPRAMADTLRRLVLGDVLGPASSARLTQWMVDCKTGAKRLRSGLPGGWRVGDKTGNNGGDAVSDIAVAWPARGGPVVICAYTQGGRPKPPQIEAVFAGVGQAVGERLA